MEWTIQAEPSSPAQGLSMEEEVLSRLIQQNCDEARARVLLELENVRSAGNAADQHGQAWQEEVQLNYQGQPHDEASHGTITINSRGVGITGNQMGKNCQIHDEANLDEEKDDDSEVFVSANIPTDVLSFSHHKEFVNVPHMNIAHERRTLLDALNDFHARVVEPGLEGFQRAMIQIEQMVNAVLDHVEKLDNAFKCRRVSAESLYECHSRNNIDIFVTLENMSPGSFILEDMKTPTGFARVRLTSDMTSEATSSMTSDAASDMTSSVSKLAKYCTETDSGEYYLSPKKLCKRFAALVAEASLDALDNTFVASHRRKVSFYNEENAQDEVTAFSVGLIPTIQCSDTWPLCACWLRTCSRKWPEASVKDEVINGGIDLVAMPTAKDRDELWRISFSSARRRLIRSVYNESKEKCLRILNGLYEQDLLRPKAISPSHLENVVLWASKKYWSPGHWSDVLLPDRFLELLSALHRCLKSQDCFDFFVPAFNLFAQSRPEVLQVLAAKVKDVLEDPYKYLQL